MGEILVRFSESVRFKGILVRLHWNSENDLNPGNYISLNRVEFWRSKVLINTLKDSRNQNDLNWEKTKLYISLRKPQ